MNIQQLMKQAQAMQKKVQDMQEKLAVLEYQGSAGGDMVSLTLSGQGELKAIKIKPAAVSADDVEMLEDLIVAAFNDAKKKADDANNDAMKSVTGGMGLPGGMKMPF